MEPTDLTLRVLTEIRDEQRGTRAEIKEMKDEFKEMKDEMHQMNVRFEARFEAIETTLRDLAQQMVMLARGIKVALESKSDVDRRVTDLEHRVEVLEKPAH